MKYRCLWAISNETVAGIEISFKEKDTKYLEFPFVYYVDDPIREDHDWELFDRLSPRKRMFVIAFLMITDKIESFEVTRWNSILKRYGESGEIVTLNKGLLQDLPLGLLRDLPLLRDLLLGPLRDLLLGLLLQNPLLLGLLLRNPLPIS
ncbi:hypothetical protein F8388_026312 [Cannabis sativa]|uniref:Ycf2 N-terminal domain-containing protein n=1 Tax=Cannabis sativa TaxID=3483 RepID=A0A7J6DSV5_CANSA|nr:hypothetical protein F8388_026312 [Cannabis sativa]KAF4368114.1 hypothetical protein G4B88_001018 [Cannabis sativa]